MSSYNEEEYENLKNSKFKQQKLPGWRPLPSMLRTVIIFFIFAIIFLCLGGLLIYFSFDIVDQEVIYSNISDSKSFAHEFTINKTLKKPIMVYYELHGFYQNHHKYMHSKSEKQLRGENISKEEAENVCNSFTNKDMDKSISVTNSPLNEQDVAIPCGLIGKSYFNDNFKNWKINGEILNVDSTNISREYDRTKRYKDIDLSKQWISMTDEHFMVWMRPSPLPNFRKLWGRIKDRDIEKGSTISLEIENNFNVSAINGSKYIIFTTVNIFGGNNFYLGISYIVFGLICIILAINFMVWFKKKEKKD